MHVSQSGRKLDVGPLQTGLTRIHRPSTEAVKHLAGCQMPPHVTSSEVCHAHAPPVPLPEKSSGRMHNSVRRTTLQTDATIQKNECEQPFVPPTPVRYFACVLTVSHASEETEQAHPVKCIKLACYLRFWADAVDYDTVEAIAASVWHFYGPCACAA